MADVDEIIDYIKSLKKGFDKNEFQLMIDNLAAAVDGSGLEYDDFHSFFKIWLNLSIPVTKWVAIGVCLVPMQRVEARTVQYAIRWLLANFQNHTSFSRMGFLLDWLTAAMDSDLIDMAALDSGYEVFYRLLGYEILTPHAMKLMYTLSKPVDVTRRRVVELNDIARKREATKSKCRQIQVLLGLFKSYKPEFVPEGVPAFSIHTAFKKINANLMNRFRRSQAYRDNLNEQKQHLIWSVPFNKGDCGRGRKGAPLVPNLEFVNVGSKQYSQTESMKNYLDFSDPASLLEYSLRHHMSRPARVRALLCNDAGLVQLATASDELHAFLSHDLCHLLSDCFLHQSPYSYEEKRDLLRRLASLQRLIMQGIPVVTRFLAQYLTLWNEQDYFTEILSLVEWISVDSPSHVPYILRPLGRVYQRAPPLHQCAILRALVNLYTNLAFASTRQRQHFMSMQPSPHYAQLMTSLAVFIDDICNKSLQVSPNDMRILHESLHSMSRVSECDLLHSLPLSVVPGALSFALPLVGCSGLLLDQMAGLMLNYKIIFARMMKRSTSSRIMEDQMWTLKAYTIDMINCLWREKMLSERQSGAIFNKLHPQLVGRLNKNVPNADSALSLKSHPAFAPNNSLLVEAKDFKDNKLLFDTVIESQFNYLSRFLKKVVPEILG